MTWWRQLFLRLAGVRAPVYAIGPHGIVVVRAPGRLSLEQRIALKASIETILNRGGEMRGALVLEGGVELVGIINPVGTP